MADLPEGFTVRPGLPDWAGIGLLSQELALTVPAVCRVVAESYRAQAAAAETPTTPVPGTRTVRRHGEAADWERWQGTIDHPAYPDFHWKDHSVQRVIEKMDAALGPVHESAYQIHE